MSKIKFKVGKLIRDNMAEIMRLKTIRVFERVMDNNEYEKALREKLIEEANEVNEADSREELIKEIADILEVLEALAKINKIDLAEIYKIKEDKRKEKGGFEKKIYSQYAEIDLDTQQ